MLLLAIDKAIDKIFRAEHGMRTTAKHVAIVMTDGKSQDDVVGPSNKAKDAGDARVCNNIFSLCVRRI